MDRATITNIARDMTFFLGANAIGFFSGALVYNISMAAGFISPQSVEANIVELHHFFNGVVYIWLACVFISIGFFIPPSHKKWRWAFLLCPILIPLIYGLLTLNTLSVIP